MPRNSAGVYSLPVASYVSGTTIKSADMNTNLSDIGTALTQSVATTGVSTMTGPLISFAGTVAAPGITWAGDTGTGFFLAGSHQIGIATNGTLLGTFNSDQSVTWKGAHTFQAAVTISAGGLAVTGASTFNTAVTLKAAFILGAGGSFDSSTVFVGSGASHTIGTVPDPGASAGTTRFLREDSSWQVPAFVIPTVTRLLVGSGNYLSPAGALHLRIRMCGPGGGGGAQITNSGGNGSAASSFGAWTANPGNGGAPNAGAGGAGGSGGTNGVGTLINRVNGGTGNPGGSVGVENVFCPGGQGGANLFMGAGAGGQDSAAGGAAAPNTGAGGGGGGNDGSNTAAGAGGGAGEYVEFWVSVTATNVAYVVGAKGSGGIAGVRAGGNGADGIIIIEEFYF